MEEKIYENKENAYVVCTIDYNKSLITAVGYMPYIGVGETVKLSGEWFIHHNYGEQFKVAYYEKVLPTSITLIEKYLSSGIIKGIREATAKKIIKKFGDKSLEIIRNQPDLLSEIKGISKKKAIEINKSFEEQNEMRNTIMFLQQYGISPNYAIRAYKKFGKNATEQIKENPYILCEQIEGITFKIADKIALNLGIEYNNTERIRTGIKYILSRNTNNGHTYLPKETLVEIATETLEIFEEEVNNLLITMAIDKDIYTEQNKEDKKSNIYLYPLHHAELGVAKNIKTILRQSYADTTNNKLITIENIEKEIGISLAEQQKEAIKQALSSGIVVITGGPGTGKTTTINAIIRVMESQGKKIALAAPTGRAAKRMAELTGKETKTIHRLLEIGYVEDKDIMQFEKNELNPLEVDLVIIDEASMVDIILMNELLKAIAPGTRLILVGDIDQLPSVGPGNVLKDIIESETINVVKLTEIFRQAKQSMIIVNAHKINKGQYPYLNKKDKDFYFLPAYSSSEIISLLLKLCQERLPKSYNYNPKEIQVLTPMRKTSLGVSNLNMELQKQLNPLTRDKKEKIYGKLIFREEDKVMQIKNNYEIEWYKPNEEEVEAEKGKGIFNGDIGYIKTINEDSGTIIVVFDEDKYVEYSNNQLDELEHAYAITIHKSQGSEFPAVIIPMFPGAPMLMSRNLFYTAITRACELVVLVGREDVIKYMIDNNRIAKRYSNLKYKLKKMMI